MSPEIARLVAFESFRASASLGNLIPILKEHLSGDEYEVLAKALAHCVAEIGQEILNKVFAEHPNLQKDLDRRVQEFGRAF